MQIVTFDVLKLDNSKFFKGKKGELYCTLVLTDKPGEYSDGFCRQGVSKEERQAGVKMPICGNYKNYTFDGGERRGAPSGGERQAPARQEPPPADDDGDSIPF